jgi:biotin carboxyl carrier protein
MNEHFHGSTRNPVTRNTAVKLHIEINGKTYEVEYDTEDEESGSSAPSTRRAQSLILPTSKMPTAETGSSDESKVFRSPVAGIVTRIDVAPGQRVQAGEILILVEAMKMENSLTAGSSATVASVEVEVGQTVKAGQIAIVFE